MPQFTRQAARPMTGEHYRRAARRLREIADTIERLADASHPRDKGTRTSAINGLSRYARALFRRNAGIRGDSRDA